MKTTQYLKLEKRIAVGERGGIVDRWRYGRALLAAKAGRKKLPDGLLANLVNAAEKAGIKGVSEQEIQRRIRCAQAYQTEADCVRAGRDFGSWTALREAGFPPVEAQGCDYDDDLEADVPDSWEQLQLDIPGLKPVISVRGRKVALVEGEHGGTVADVAAYRDIYRQMHENYGKTLDLIEESLRTMLDGSGGDETANAVEAWEAGIDSDDGDPEHEFAIAGRTTPAARDQAERTLPVMV